HLLPLLMIRRVVAPRRRCPDTLSPPYASPSRFSFFLPLRPPPRSTLFPYTTLFRSLLNAGQEVELAKRVEAGLYAEQKLKGEERSEEHTSELQSRFDLVCRLLLEKKKIAHNTHRPQSTRRRRSSALRVYSYIAGRDT